MAPPQGRPVRTRWNQDRATHLGAPLMERGDEAQGRQALPRALVKASLSTSPLLTPPSPPPESARFSWKSGPLRPP